MAYDTGISKPGYAPRGAAIILFLLRLGLGGLMFEAGLTKLLEGFSAAGFLNNSTGPLSGFFRSLVDYINVINVLVPWGEILIGTALILGLLVRFASFWGAIEVFTFYLAVLPPAQGWINYQIVLVLVFLTFLFTGVGYFLGLDIFLMEFEKRRHWLRFLLG